MIIGSQASKLDNSGGVIKEVKQNLQLFNRSCSFIVYKLFVFQRFSYSNENTKTANVANVINPHMQQL